MYTKFHFWNVYLFLVPTVIPSLDRIKAPNFLPQPVRKASCVVSILKKENQLCTGSRVSQRVIVTAADCLKDWIHDSLQRQDFEVEVETQKNGIQSFKSYKIKRVDLDGGIKYGIATITVSR